MKTAPPLETIDDTIPEGSDLELMAYFDGELEEPRRAEVERLFEANGAKIAGLELGAALVRERFLAVVPSDGMVDSVMAAIDREDGAPVQVDRQAETKREGALARELTGPASNDNGRFIFRLAAVAAAAAAALFFWGRSDVDEAARLSTATEVPVISEGAPSTEVAKMPTQAIRPEKAAPVDEEAPGVEVASVDFGTRTGSIYYVSGATNGATTPVVWLSDE